MANLLAAPEHLVFHGILSSDLGQAECLVAGLHDDPPKAFDGGSKPFGHERSSRGPARDLPAFPDIELHPSTPRCF